MRAVLAMLVCAAVVRSAAGQDAQVFVQLGHSSAVTALAFSPDGSRLASAGQDGAVKVWDVESGRVAQTLTGHSGGVLALAYAPDGTTLLSAGRDRTLQLWDARTGAPLGVYHGHASLVLGVAFLPTGREFVSVGYDRAVRRWRIGQASSAQIGSHDGPARALDVSSDGRLVASGGEDRAVRLWTVAGESVGTHRFQSGVLSVRFSPDGSRFAAGLQDGTLGIVPSSGGAERLLRGHAGQVSAVAWSGDGRHLASASADGTVRVWDAAEGRELVSLRPGGEQNAVAFSPSTAGAAARTLQAAATALVASGGQDHAVRLWKTPSGEAADTLRSRVAEITAADVAADGSALAVAAADDAVRVWDADRGQVARVLRAAGTVESLRFSADGARIAAASREGTLQLWERGSGRELLKVRAAHRGGALAVAISPDAAMLASGGRDGWVRLWDARSGTVRRELAGHRGAVRDVEFSQDGRLVASAGSDDTVRIWDTGSGSLVALLKGHANRVNAVRFAAGGTKLVSASEDSSVRIWDPRSGAQLAALAGHAGPVKAIALDAARIYSVGSDGTIALWDMREAKLLRRAPLDAGQLRAVAVSPRGYLAAGGDGGVTVIRDAGALDERARLYGFVDNEWVSIVPRGHFNASQNGARYLNVRAGARVYGLDQFLESFLRPEVVAAALAGGQAEAARPGAPGGAQALGRVLPPPAVTLVGIPAETAVSEVNVRVRIDDRGGGVGDVRVYLNGAAIVQDRSSHRASGPGERQYLVRLVAGSNRIRATAFNGENTMESASGVHEVIARMPVERRPSLHALVIGIDEFVNPRLRLSYSVADARLFGDVLERRAAGLFESVHVRRMLAPAETSRAGVITALAEMRDRVAPEDLFVFYVASHGTVDEGEYFLLTSNVGATSTARLRADAISERELRDVLSNIPATKKLIVLDTCHAGRLGDVLLATRGLAEDRAAKVLARAVGSTVLSAATSLQQAVEGYNGHGLFTYVVTEGLSGKADFDRDGFVKTTELAVYVDNEVPELAEKVFRHKQFPIVAPTGIGFPLTRAH